MAPKGSKRAAKAAREDSPKRAKAAHPPEPQPKLTRVMRAVIGAIERSADLPDTCRAMLKEGALRGLAVPVDERHEVQAMYVRWIGECLDGMVARLREDAEAASADVVDLDATLTALESRLFEQQNALVAAKEAQNARRAAIPVSSAAIASAQQALNEAREVQRKAEAELAASRADKERLDAIVKDRVPALQAGCEGPHANAHLQAVLPFARRIGVDESFLNALPASALKPASERGSFDATVLNELQKSLTEKATEFSPKLEAGAAAVAECSVAIEAAEKELATKQQAHAELEARVAGDAETVKAVTRSAGEAREAVAAFKATNKSRLADRDAKAAKLEAFISYEVECFKLLRDKESPAALAAKAAAAEAATAAVEMAVAEVAEAKAGAAAHAEDEEAAAA